MNLSPGFWAHNFETVFVQAIEDFRQLACERVIPSLDGFEALAESDACESERRKSRSDDESGFALEEMYERMESVRIARMMDLAASARAITNLCVVGLWHLVEQQLMEFHRKQLLSIEEDRDIPGASHLLKRHIMAKHLKAAGIDLESILKSHRMLELELLANTIKHADGTAAQKLQNIRPDLFTKFPGSGFRSPPLPREIRSPLLGEDVCLQAKEIIEYANLAVVFWRGFAKVLRESEARRGSA